MKMHDRFCLGLIGCVLGLMGWLCPPGRAAQPVSEPENAVATFAKGPLPPRVAEQVRTIVWAQVKAFLPAPEEGAVEIDRLEKDAILAATVNGQKYSGKVYRSFLVQPLNASEFEAMEEFYVRTAAPWPLKAGLVIPADTYLAGMAERVSAFDADMVAAQDAAIARSEALSKRALAQLDPELKAKTAEITKAHKDDVDSLAKQVKDLQAEVDKKVKNRQDAIAQLAGMRPQPTVPLTIRGYRWTPGQGFTFNDGLDESRQNLAEALSEQKTLQASVDAELAAAKAQSGAKTRAVRAVFLKHSRSIRAGEIISDEDMRADYEAALGEPLKEGPASGKPEPANRLNARPPIQAVPAPSTAGPPRKSGT